MVWQKYYTRTKKQASAIEALVPFPMLSVPS